MPFAKLSLERIVEEAIALMYAEGLDQVTLRNLAARLDVRAPSLYRHVSDKDALHARMSERIFRQCLAAVPESGSWQDWLLGFGRALWQAQRRGAGVLRLVQAHAQEDRVTGVLRDQVVATLRGLGMTDRDALLAMRSVQALVTGWTTLRRAPDPATDEADFTAALATLIDGWSKRTGAS